MLVIFCVEDAAALDIVLVPLGKVPPAYVRAVAGGFEGFGPVKVVVASPAPLPASAYYAPRKRYRADRLLVYLQGFGRGAKVVGLTSVDISTSKGSHKDWGVFGLGSLNGTSCVVSSFRLGSSRGPKLQRLASVARHELGHTLGLPHCPTPRCLMADARGSVLTVDREQGLCGLCRRRLARR